MQALRRSILASVLMLGIGGMAVAQDRVTIMLRSGETVNGRFDGVSQGLFYIDVSDTDERKIPLGQVALIDLVGGASGLPETELSQARGSQHVLLMRNGSLTKGQLVHIEGARVSGNEDPAWVIFRTEGGEERRVRMSDVGRLYLGNYPGAAPATSNPTTPSTGGSVQTSGQTRVVTLPGNTQWLDTGLTVRQGDRLVVTATGEITLSNDGGDKASPAGSLRAAHAARAPLPNVITGALIGRIGNGMPFPVGGNADFAASGSGRFYLGINDDNVGDNGGQFDIRVTPQSGDTTRRRR